MYRVELDVSNDTAQNTVHEINAFLAFENERMAGGPGAQEGHGTAASGYVLLRRVRDQILRQTEERTEKIREQQLKKALRGPSVREARKAG